MPGRKNAEAGIGTRTTRWPSPGNWPPAGSPAPSIRQAVDQGDHGTSDQFQAGLAEVRAEISALDTRLSPQIAEVRTEVSALDTRLSKQIAGVRTEIARTWRLGSSGGGSGPSSRPPR